MRAVTPLAGVRVVELGSRVAVGACGTLLASLGAHVLLREASARGGKWRNEPLVSAGKTFIGGNDVEAALRDADVVLLSSDIDTAALPPPSARQIICDITAYGSSGPLKGLPHSDGLVQAMCGLADTTGEPDGPPLLCGFAACEGLAALHAAAAIAAALRMRARDSLGQRIEITLYEATFSGFASFVPFPVTGKPISRAGNRHVSAAPWNLYEAKDGPLVICTATDEQWQRLCALMERADLASDGMLASAAGRIAAAGRLDAAVADWARSLPSAELAQRLNAQGIPAGPIVAFEDLAREPNIRHRGLLQGGVQETAIRHFGGAASPSSVVREAGATGALPLQGIKVLDLGQFTTAPLVARHLGALGAEVLKVESPTGDASRAWTPRRENLSLYFALSNSDKRSLSLDLRRPEDLARFRALARDADVLVENLKPGSLARLGLSPEDLSRLNPRMVYCAISGFGADSAYPGRAAFDTVIQAMSGMMDLTRSQGVPQKVGLSLADVVGGMFGLVAVLASLYAREQSARAGQVDISMQDAAAWLAQLRSSGIGDRKEAPHVVHCRDGYAVAEAAVPAAAESSRAEFVAQAAGLGIQAAPVLTMAEVVDAPQTRERGLLLEVPDSLGRPWPAFTSPLRMQRTPPSVRGAIGPLGEANGALGWSEA